MAVVALDLADSALLDAVRRIRWPARRLVRSGHTGSHLARTLGQSPEFTEYRAYRQGDETRRIDWKLLARTDRAYIRLAQDRTLLPTMLLVDASASMAYPVPSLEKWEHARRVALGLAAATHQGGDPVGLAVVAGDGARRLPARTRRGVVQELAAVLRGVAPTGTAVLGPHLLSLRSSGRVAIVSDFLGDTDSLLAIAGPLCAQGKEVYAIHVIHATELDPPRDASLFTDPEDAHFKRPMMDQTRAKYLARFGDWCDELARSWRMRGAYYVRVVTGEPAASAVRRITLPSGAR
jgi:uncharacterized protein (DUF58 family)